VKKLIVTLIVGALLALPLSVLAMDAVTNAELDGVAGQAGVTIAFGGTSTTRIQFSQLGWGDPDGLGTCGSLAGWLIINGNIIIDQVIADGQTLVLDIGTTGAATCDIVTTDAVMIPANTTFIAVGLPDVNMSISVPSTLNIGLANTSSPIDGTLGILNLRSLDITAGTPNTLYIWAHP
jgi:hypothetical protein